MKEGCLRAGLRARADLGAVPTAISWPPVIAAACPAGACRSSGRPPRMLQDRSRAAIARAFSAARKQHLACDWRL